MVILMKKKKKVIKKQVKKKRFRIKFKFVFMFLLLLCIVGVMIYYIINLKITNIYISGNSYLTDQEIIELANLEDYPKILKNSNSKIKQRLEKDIYINKAKITKKLFTQIFITIEENKPLFYNQLTTKTILLNGKSTEDLFSIPVLVNNIPDSIYEEFLKKMGKLNIDVLNKISEIKYDPDEVDDERFLFSMTDLNYVYLTLNKLESINDYNSIIKQFDNKKGILYLNSGGYFEVK